MKANKHDHKGTKALKTALFSIVMLLPIISIGATILTHTFNEKVNTPSKDVNITYMYETNEVNSQEDLIEGNIYTFNYNVYDIDALFNDDTELFFIPLTDIVFNTEEETSSYVTIDETTYNPNISKRNLIYLYSDENKVYTYVYFGGNSMDNYILLYWEDYNNIIDFIELENNLNFIYMGGYNLNIQDNIILKTPQEEIPIQSVEVTETTDTITNIFEYASNEVFNTSVFGWTNSSIIKTPISAFTSVFGVDNANVLNNYLTYWLAVTGIYIVIDIIIETFVFITHLLNKDGI